MNQIIHTVLEEKEQASDSLMSNFDGHVNPEIKAWLMESSDRVADYPAWDFHAMVWYEAGEWHGRVKRYREVVGWYSADSPEELMREISDIYGWK